MGQRALRGDLGWGLDTGVSRTLIIAECCRMLCATFVACVQNCNHPHKRFHLENSMNFFFEMVAGRSGPR